MPYNFPDLHAEKNSVVRELFISTADDNYILARWCFQQRLNVDFFWLAVHCLEKYFKAVLLMNGHSSNGYGHDIVRLYDAVQPLAPELLISEFARPENMPAGMWRNETVMEFLARLYQDGNAHNRYLIYGYVRNAEDLFKLDQVVFSVRRLTQALEVRYVGDGENDGLPTYSRREALARRPTRHENMQSNLEQTMEGKRGVELQRVLFNWNFPFTDHRYQHEQSTFMSASQNPILMTRLYDPLDCGTSHFAEADRFWEWVQENIYLPGALVKEIETERVRRKADTTAAGRV
ncbi:hypothetical protein [Tardiphaga sp. 803_E3_N1_3]|uniref:hypothetical protein n=1 Tax=Tardiphaga sp. 803_E3_N1_3 TaxID=3240785 RepID=UPI003F230CA0